MKDKDKEQKGEGERCGVIRVCPRCREVLEAGCSGNCSRCGK